MQNKTYAVITGASSGIGRAFAFQLAKSGYNLIICARRIERLIDVKIEIERAYPVDVHAEQIDLSAPNAAFELFTRACEISGNVQILVNNAGYGKHASFLEQDLMEIKHLIRVNVTVVTELTYLFAAQMKRQRYGKILQLASIAAFQPSPKYAVYAAAKSFILEFAYALNLELAGSGVSVSTLCPGMTDTEFMQVAGQRKSIPMRLMAMHPARVARIGLRGMQNGKPLIIPGFVNNLNSFLVELMPRWLSARIAGLVMG